MADAPGDVTTGRWFEPLLRNLPADVRYRLFNPAYEDLRLEHASRRASARDWPGRRLVGAAVLAVRIILLILACYRTTPGFVLRRPFRAVHAVTRRTSATSHQMLSHDIRLAVRSLWKQPLFSAVAVTVLAIGLASSAAIFAVVNAVLLRPLPFPAAGRLVAIEETAEGLTSAVSPVNFYDWQRQAKSFSSMAIYTDAHMTLAVGDRAVAVSGFAASSGFFPTLGVKPAIGRWFTAEDDRAGSHLSVVLSHGLWQRAFGGRLDIVGHQAMFDGTPYTVIGVTPPGTGFPEDADAWFSLALSDRSLAAASRGAHYVSAIGRLRPSVVRDEAATELRAIAAALAVEYPRTNRESSVRVTDLMDSVVGTARPALILLLGGVACLLLIACVNVSGLLLARSAGRRTEGAIRAALGAGRFALVRQALLESLVIGVAAATAASLTVAWGMGVLVAMLPSDLPRGSAVSFNGSIFLFTMTIGILSSLCLGAIPAWQAARSAPGCALQTARRDGAAAGSLRLRGLLIATEVALALMLSIGAALSVRSSSLLAQVSPGFDPRGVLTFWVSLPEGVYRDGSQVRRFFDDLDERLARLPGVVSTGAVMIPPVARMGFGGTFSIDGRAENPADEPRAQLRPASPGYFATLGVRVLRGRGFERHDDATAPAVAVVSETTARRYWPGENPVGKRLRMHVSAVAGREPDREVVGVVQDVKTGRLQQPPAPVVYVPHQQHPTSVMTILVRTKGDPAAAGTAVGAALHDADQTVVAQDLMTLEDHVSRARADQRFRAALLGMFALAAAFLAVVGLYAVVAYATGRRRHEIGVRVALGATQADVIRLVVGESLRPVVAGLAAGGVGAYMLSWWLRGLLFGVRPFEPIVVVSVALVLGVAACLACYVPARRSASVDPREALRAE